MSIPALTAALAAFSRQPILAACGAVLLLTACAETAPPQVEAPATSPAASLPDASTPPERQVLTSFSEALSGRYVRDIEHSSLQFKVVHAFIANYIVRFNDFDVSLVLDADNLANSTVTVSVDPTSVDSGHSLDYRATRPNARFDTWNETMAQHDNWFAASQYPQITFQSTQVQQTGPGTLRVTGDLTLRGQTHPVTMDVTLVGALHAHHQTRNPALGISAVGKFNRSLFGMTQLVGAGVSDEVTVLFEGEFLQAEEPGA